MRTAATMPVLVGVLTVGLGLGAGWAQEPPAAPPVPAPQDATPPAPAPPLPDVAPSPAPVPVPPSTAPPAEAPRATTCPRLNDRVSEKLSPIQILSEHNLPPGTQKSALSAADMKCVESLRAAGKKAIEEKKAALGIHRYLAAVETAPALASDIYRELGYELDKAAYPKPAIQAYLKAWKALDVEGVKAGEKVNGAMVLSMADIRDSLARLGAQVPTPNSELGRIVVANSTRSLREKYFSSFPPKP